MILMIDPELGKPMVVAPSICIKNLLLNLVEFDVIYIYQVSKKRTISQESISTLHRDFSFIACTSDVLHPSRAYMLNELGPLRWAYLYSEYIKERLAAKHV